MSLLLFAFLAQTVSAAPPRIVTTPPQVAVPFEIGETFTYSGSIRGGGILPWVSAGSTTLSVVGVEKVRGVDAWKFSMVTDIKSVLYKAHSELHSWTTVNNFISLRFLKITTDTSETRLAREDFNIYPDSGWWRRNNDAGHKPTPENPLDDLAFIYFIRTYPLKLNDNVVIPRYYRMDARNLTIKVIGRETLELPGKRKVACLVLLPVVNQKNGMFRPEAKAKLWITDDAERIPVRIESSISAGRVRLELEKITRK